MTGVVAIIQARTGSTRLPGKVLMDIAGEPMLARVMERAGRARTLDEIVVATTTETADDPIVSLCEDRGWEFFRGSESDVLDRYYRAAREYGAETIVRITSDCPLIDAGVTDKTVREFLDRSPTVDYASNIFPIRTYPRGLDTEVFSSGTLEHLWTLDKDPASREHVTLYLQKNPGKFSIHNVRNDEDLSSHRWTVDTIEDYRFVTHVYSTMTEKDFTWRDVLRLLGERPDLVEINRHVKQKVV